MPAPPKDTPFSVPPEKLAPWKLVAWKLVAWKLVAWKLVAWKLVAWKLVAPCSTSETSASIAHPVNASAATKSARMTSVDSEPGTRTPMNSDDSSVSYVPKRGPIGRSSGTICEYHRGGG